VVVEVTINQPNQTYTPYTYPNTYQTTYYTPKETDPKLLEVLERIADALEELAY
jgi:hypothetical protein